MIRLNVVMAIWIACSMPMLSWATDGQYDWEKTRERYKLTEAEQQTPELVLKSHFEFNYGFDNDQFVVTAVVHRIVLVNNTEAVQRNNRLSIPMRNVIDLVDLKARTLSRDGKFVYFDRNNLKEVKDEESGQSFRIFALEGVELGSEVEVFYILKKSPSLFDKLYLQGQVPIRNASFILRSPKHLKFDFRSYKGFPEVKTTETEEQNVYTAAVENVPGAKEEMFSFYDANRMRVLYKLAYNTARSNARLNTWEDAAKTFHTILTTLEKDDVKALDKFVKSLKDKPTAPVGIRVRNLEDQIKTQIQINTESSDPSLDIMASVVRYKVASREGITKLMANVFSRLGIGYQAVITCSREGAVFDETFDTWDYLDHYILYIPETQQFLAPAEKELRYPLIPAEYTSQKGLFIEAINVGGVQSALGTIQDIPALPFTLTQDNLDINVVFATDLASHTVRQKRKFTGYYAATFTAYYPQMTEDQKSKMVESMITQTAPGATVKKWTCNPDTHDEENTFEMDVEYTSSNFIERAGNRLLFKFGLLIGPQSEMYSEDKRMNPVETTYNHGYDRIIRFTIPDGYSIRNPQDLKFDVRYQDGNQTPFLFVSDYTLENNILTVKIQEHYKQIYAPLSRYEDYRKVINAAADFNKVTLVLEKKK